MEIQNPYFYHEFCDTIFPSLDSGTSEVTGQGLVSILIDKNTENAFYVISLSGYHFSGYVNCFKMLLSS